MKTFNDLSLILKDYRNGDGELPDYKFLAQFFQDGELQEKLFHTAFHLILSKSQDAEIIRTCQEALAILGMDYD